MDQDDLGKRARKIPEQAVAPFDFRIAFTESVEQAIDRVRELARVRIVGNGHAPTDRGVTGRFEQFLVESGDTLRQLPP